MLPMRRLPREELETRLYVALKVLPKHITGKLRSKLPHESDATARLIAQEMVKHLDGDSCMVIEADAINALPYGTRPGRFGVTEPSPV